MTAEVSLLTNIGDMIDLAIGSPEIGVVDFCMLHTVLHCLAQQLAVNDKNVELRGAAAQTAMPIGKDFVNTVAVYEFVVEADGKDSESKKLKAHDRRSRQSDPETLLIVERIKKDDPSSQSGGVPGPASASMATSGAVGGSPGGPTPAVPLSLVTMSKFHLLENVVDDIKNRVYGSMPKNEDILQEVRSQTNMKAITDMWSSLNISSRLEAAEEAITKLSSLVQDFIRENPILQENAETRMDVTPGAPLSAAPTASADQSASLLAHVHRLREDLDALSNNFYTAMKDLKPGLEPPAPASVLPPPLPNAPPAYTDQNAAGIPDSLPGTAMTEILDRLLTLEKRLVRCCESIDKKDGTVQDQMDNFQDQLAYLMKQVSDITADISTGKLSPDLIKDLQGLMELFQTVQSMKAQLQQVHETAMQLAAEKDDRQYHMNALLEQIDLLKTIKLDREDMIEAMADKADLRMLARKVSHDQFEMACDDLSKGLEQTIGKLNFQEALWQQALDDIQREIETKLDKMELSPVKEFFNKKLSQLQEHLKKLSSLRREAEAAGTKRKLLRDVNCISCDAQAVMATEATVVGGSKPLPGTLSMKPYLSYELDAIRKAQASNTPQRNLHDWEAIDKQMTQTRQPQRVRSETDKHICNRYCGGSHTVTTPAQRVARTGHFIKQWGPDVVPLSSGFATGDDGRMYKVSPVGAVNGPGGAVDAASGKRKSIDTSKPTPKLPAASAIYVE